MVVNPLTGLISLCGLRFGVLQPVGIIQPFLKFHFLGSQALHECRDHKVAEDVGREKGNGSENEEQALLAVIQLGHLRWV